MASDTEHQDDDKIIQPSTIGLERSDSAVRIRDTTTTETLSVGTDEWQEFLETVHERTVIPGRGDLAVSFHKNGDVSLHSNSTSNAIRFTAEGWDVFLEQIKESDFGVVTENKDVLIENERESSRVLVLLIGVLVIAIGVAATSASSSSWITYSATAVASFAGGAILASGVLLREAKKADTPLTHEALAISQQVALEVSGSGQEEPSCP